MILFKNNEITTETENVKLLRRIAYFIRKATKFNVILNSIVIRSDCKI